MIYSYSGLEAGGGPRVLLWSTNAMWNSTAHTATEPSSRLFASDANSGGALVVHIDVLTAVQ